MKTMIDNLINGNLKDAKRQAKRYRQADIMQFCIDEYGMGIAIYKEKNDGGNEK